MSRLKNRLRNLRLVAASVGFALLVLEVAARLLLPVADVPWHTSDDLLGYRLAPNQSGRWAGEGTIATFRINGSGYNNEHDYEAPLRPGRARIAVLGDSFVESMIVDRGRRFFDRLESGLAAAGRPAEVFTYAVSGYGTAHENLLLEHEAEKAAPDLVIALFVVNDLEESACSVSISRAAPCFRLDGRGELEREPAERHRPNLLARAGMRSALARYLLINRDLIGWWRARGGNLRNPQWLQAYALSPPPAWEEAWRVVEASFAAMARSCARRGVPLLVIHQAIVARDFAERIRTFDGGGAPDVPAQRLAGMARRCGFEFFDLTPAFAAAGGPDRLLNRGIGHWNERAHEAAAAALVPRVLDLLERRKPGSLSEPRESR